MTPESAAGKVYRVTMDGREYTVEVLPDAVRVDGQAVPASLKPLGVRSSYGVRLGSSGHSVHAERHGDGVWSIETGGRSRSLRVIDERTHAIEQLAMAAKGAQGPSPVRANMPGLVVSVRVEVGQAVQGGEGMVIVEAMKMENELRAETDGVVHRIHVSAGDTVQKDQVLIEFQTPEADPS